MADSPQICPICLVEKIDQAVTQSERAVQCDRCGEFSITREAEDQLRFSDAPPPAGYVLSHALRWAARDRWATPELSSIFIDSERARRIIQRRQSRNDVKPSSRAILRWLVNAAERQDALKISGWASVVNDFDVISTQRKLDRLVRWSLVETLDSDNGLIRLRLTEFGVELLGRQTERHSRIFKRRRQSEDDASSRLQAGTDLYFNRLRVAGFKCFSDCQSISFCKEDGLVSRWTFLIGENGVGKTSILQLLAGLFPAWRRRNAFPRLAVDAWQDDHPSLHHMSDSFAAEAEMHQGILEDQLIDPVNLGVHKTPPELDDFQFSLRLASDSIIISWGSGSFSYATNTDRLPRSPFIVGYGAGRVVGKTGLLSTKDRADGVDGLFNPDVPLYNPEEWLLQNDYAARFEGGLSQERSVQSDKLTRALLDILPDVHQISVQAPDDQHDRPWVAFETSFGLVDYSSLSVGYQSTIAWVVDLAIRLIDNYPDSIAPLESPGIVLIDEIDAHLHPRWQRSITSHLQQIFPRVQFIATTHSPLIIQGAVEANIILLKKERDRVIAINDVDEIREYRVDQILTSELFGLDSARPNEISELNRRRIEILSGENPDLHELELQALNRRLGDSLEADDNLDQRARELLAKLKR